MASIVFADDEANNRFVIGLQLGFHGHEVRLAADGREALELIRERRPDLVILDLMMPVLDGYEVCRVLRADPETADLPVLALSAVDNIAASPKFIEAGFSAMVPKPFRMEELRGRIETLLQEAEQSRSRSKSELEPE